MHIFPAIDLRGGQVVRLSEGDYDRMDVYDSDPIRVLERFMEQGATNLHVVDLDAAKGDGQRNFPVIERIVQGGAIFIEVGGGARDEASVRRYLDAGVNRVILGTMAVEKPDLLSSLAQRYQGRIAVGVDAKDGKVAIHGWRQVTDLDAFAFMEGLPGIGIDTAIYTDIARDGMLMGPNFVAYEQLRAISGLRVIASGGVSSIEDIIKLRDMGNHGAIVGKALYEGKINLRRAIALAEGKEG